MLILNSQSFAFLWQLMYSLSQLTITSILLLISIFLTFFDHWDYILQLFDCIFFWFEQLQIVKFIRVAAEDDFTRATTFMLVIEVFRTAWGYYLYFRVPHSTALVSWLCNICFRNIFFLNMVSRLSYFGRRGNRKRFFSARLPRHPHRIQLLVGSMMVAFDLC